MTSTFYNGEVVSTPADAPVLSVEQLAANARALAKHDRALAVSKIVVTVSSGKVFDGNESATKHLSEALIAADILGLTETTWTLADNSIVTVTKAELQEAFALAVLRKSELWPVP